MGKENAPVCAKKTFTEDTVLIQRGEKLNQMAVLMSGRIEAVSGNVRLILQPGAILDIGGVNSRESVMNYKSLENGIISVFNYHSVEDFKTFLGQGEQCRRFLIKGSVNQVRQLIDGYRTGRKLLESTYRFVREQYANYQEICSEIGCEVKGKMALEDIQEFEWNLGESQGTVDYFNELFTIESDMLWTFFETGDAIVTHHIKELGRLVSPLLRGIEMYTMAIEDSLPLLCGNGEDNLFMLYMELLKNSTTPKGIVKNLLGSMQKILEFYGNAVRRIQEEMHCRTEADVQGFQMLFDNIAGFYMSSTEKSIMDTVSMVSNVDEYDDLTGGLDKLLEYSEADEEEREEIRTYLRKYMDLPDKRSTDDDVRTLRKKLTELFYDLYQKVFFKAEGEDRHSALIELFLNYGIVDTNLFDYQLLQQLLAVDFDEDNTLPIHVYPIRQWLHMVYKGERKTSRNEFDMDYDQYLKEENKSKGELTKEEIALQQSAKERTKFEIRNFFVMNNRLTNGHMLGFCPVMTPEDLNSNALGMMLDAKKINEAFMRVKDIDFSIFYRSVMYDSRENGINNLITHIEVYPEVILMPNVGSMGRMWQEISGKKRATPGRFTFPVFLQDDLDKLVVHAMGKFRWEMCKREQGTRWNDVTEPSLTSEFSDYLQFYKKNHDLSDKAKERVSQLLTKFRNNYGNVFAYNYVLWIESESQGNMRVDKATRSVLGRYCPFSREIRERLLEQTMYAEPLGRYEKERKKKVKEMRNRRTAIRNANGEETEEFLNEVAYYEL